MEFKKGALQKAFKNLRKTALVVVAGVSLSGCVTTGVYQSGGIFGNSNGYSNSYNMPRGYAVTYTPSRVPWANDPNYRQEVQLAVRSANLDIQSAYNYYQSSVASCNASYARAASSNARASEYARRNGTNIWERMENGARWNKASADFNYCKVQAETRFERTRISEQQEFDRALERLDTKYKRAYGYK